MKPIHNQGKQALKRIRKQLGLFVCREPLPSHVSVEIRPGGCVYSAEHVNNDPKFFDRPSLRLVKGE